VCQEDDCDLKFDAQRRGNVGSAKSLKLAIDAIVSCYVYKARARTIFTCDKDTKNKLLKKLFLL
jgi:hypothetical protein